MDICVKGLNIFCNSLLVGFVLDSGMSSVLLLIYTFDYLNVCVCKMS